MAQLNTRLVTARANAAEKKAEVDLLQKLEAEGTLAKGLPETLNSELLAKLRTLLGEISIAEASLASRTGETTPRLSSCAPNGPTPNAP